MELIRVLNPDLMAETALDTFMTFVTAHCCVVLDEFFAFLNRRSLEGNPHGYSILLHSVSHWDCITRFAGSLAIGRPKFHAVDRVSKILFDAAAATEAKARARNDGNTVFLSEVMITGTCGQFSCTPTILAPGQTITISGTLGDSGTISGYTNPTTYYIVSTNGNSTFTLSTTPNGPGVSTSAGTPAGLMFTYFPNILPTDSFGRVYGLALGEGVQFESWDLFRLKSAAGLDKATPPCVESLSFPQLHAILPLWLQGVEEKKTKKIIYLICGVGTPCDGLTAEANSTLYTAQSVALYIQRCHPSVTPVIVKSGEIFHYDSNVEFVNNIMLPLIEKRRNELATLYPDDWNKRFDMTLCLSNGSCVRMVALSATFRPFRPRFLHLWNPKRFWREWPSVDWAALQTDVEDHANDMLQTWQLTRVSKLSREIQNLVSELKAYKDQFEKCASDPKQEWSRFWLRKSKSPVICVLLTEKDGVFKYTRGINLEVFYQSILCVCVCVCVFCSLSLSLSLSRSLSLSLPIHLSVTLVEVSMPTGSLCAERNAIGSALGQDPSLRYLSLSVFFCISICLPKYFSTFQFLSVFLYFSQVFVFVYIYIYIKNDYFRPDGQTYRCLLSCEL